MQVWYRTVRISVWTRIDWLMDFCMSFLSNANLRAKFDISIEALWKNYFSEKVSVLYYS